MHIVQKYISRESALLGIRLMVLTLRSELVHGWRIESCFCIRRMWRLGMCQLVGESIIRVVQWMEYEYGHPKSNFA